MFPAGLKSSMSATEYRDALAKLGLTQVGAARLMGVSDRTSRRWASGEQDIPPPVERLIRAYIDGYRPLDWPGRALAEPKDTSPTTASE
jgi:transcriptional regulator with XRE-family HTH domain